MILATLVSINVVATIAVLSSQSLDKSTILIGGQWFCIGIITAVFVGFFQIRGAAVGIKQIPDVLDFWIDAEQNGEIDLDRHKELRSRLSLAIIPWTVLTYLSGFGSLGCFVKGASEVGARLT